VLKPNGRYVMVGAPKGKWIKPMDRAIVALMYSKFVHQQMGMMMARASKYDLALLAEPSSAGSWTVLAGAWSTA
jgi:hypothetical protein